MEWSVTLPGRSGMVPVARRFTRSMLGRAPCVDDAEAVISEIASNALLHTPSGEAGHFTVRVAVKIGWVRVEVTDQGSGVGEYFGAESEDDEFGRGLLIASVLAEATGHESGPDGHTVWAELSWREQDDT